MQCTHAGDAAGVMTCKQFPEQVFACAIMDRVVIGAEMNPVAPPVARRRCVLPDMPMASVRALYCYNWIMEHQVCIYLTSPQFKTGLI